MNEVYLCLGGNLGNCIETFTNAVKLLEKQGVHLRKYSSVYTSGAWGMEKAPDFFNQVILAKTNHTPDQLMHIILEIEKELGRERKNTGTYESRIIDIDILFFNLEIIKEATLEIPHPRLHLRRFVLEPLNEIASDLIHPTLHKTISGLLLTCLDTNSVKKIGHAF